MMDVVSESRDEQSPKKTKILYISLLLTMVIVMTTVFLGVANFLEIFRLFRDITNNADRNITFSTQTSLTSSTVSAIHTTETTRHADDILKKLKDEDTRFGRLNNETHGLRDVLHFLDLINPKYVAKNITEVSIDDAVIVTAINRNYYLIMARVLCESLMKYPNLPEKVKWNLVVYILDVPTNDIILRNLKKFCPIIKLRQFPFEMFPKHVQRLNNYSFKALVIALMLMEHKFVFWADSSTYFEASLGKINIEDYLEIMKHRKIPFAFSLGAGHSIYAATNPAMFSYLPMNESEQKKLEMKAASVMHFISTEWLKTTILFRMVQCALIERCIAPPNSALYCRFQDGDTWSTYADCHRFDQSAVNIIADNYIPGNESLYFIRGVQWTTKRN